MERYYEFTEKFHPGYQKTSLLSDAILRKIFFIFIIVTLAQVPFCYIIRHAYMDIVYVVSALVLTVPLSMSLAGGKPAAAMKWYYAFAALFALGTVPVILGGSGLFLAIVPLSLFCFYRFHRQSPRLMQVFGYTLKVPLLKELAFTLVTFAVLICTTWYAFAKTLNVSISIVSLKMVLLLLCMGMIIFGPVYGMMYGVLSRRIIDMKYQLALPMVFNILLFNIIFLPTGLVYDNPVLGVLGTAGFSFLSQFVFGLAHYFCRTTRVMFFAHVFCYVFLELIKLGS